MAFLSRLKQRLGRDGTTDVEVPFPSGAAEAPAQAQQFLIALNDLATASGGQVTVVPQQFNQPIHASFPTKAAAKDFSREVSRIG